MPHTLTCSPECSRERIRWRSRERAKLQRQRPQGCQCSQTAEGMTSSPHEPADCELAVCDRCDAYGDGYAAGKDAAYFAISTWEFGAHATDCGCRPCLAIRQAVSKVLQAAE